MLIILYNVLRPIKATLLCMIRHADEFYLQSLAQIKVYILLREDCLRMKERISSEIC